MTFEKRVKLFGIIIVRSEPLLFCFIYKNFAEENNNFL